MLNAPSWGGKAVKVDSETREANARKVETIESDARAGAENNTPITAPTAEVVEHTDSAPTFNDELDAQDEEEVKSAWTRTTPTPFGFITTGSHPENLGYKGFDGFTAEQTETKDWAVNPETFGEGAIACLPSMATVGCVTSFDGKWELAPTAEMELVVQSSYNEGTDENTVPVVPDIVLEDNMSGLSRDYFTPFGIVSEGTNPGYGAFNGFTAASAEKWAHHGDSIAPMEAGTLVCSPTVEFGCMMSDGFEWGLVSQADAREISERFDAVDYHDGFQQG
ncbi:hypothetical protein [Citricoccus nitrophenolicus]|uniref:hypothetical protein n=1 Tax=Citricoccus nitrophenolicus TaxID=863575 RepID=UPI0031E58607